MTSPRIDQCIKLTVITPGCHQFANVRTAIVAGDAFQDLLGDYEAFCTDTGGVDVALIWQADERQLGASFRAVPRERLNELNAFVDRYDETRATEETV